MDLIKSHAKLNLFLHVNGKRKDSYHNLDSLIAFCNDLYDEISIDPINSIQDQIEFTGLYSASIHQDDNLLTKSLEEFFSGERKQYFSIKIKKNIPVGAGLGGGSSNAAALFRYLNNNFTYSGKLRLLNSLNKIGSDVPVCYYDRISYFNKTGNEIFPSRLSFTPYAVILFPEKLIKTESIFASGFDKYSTLEEKKYLFNSYEEIIKFLHNKNNDLFDNTIKTSPDLKYYLDLMRHTDQCDIARMTGSGSAIFGLFKTKNKAINAIDQLKKHKSIFLTMSGLR